MDTSENSSIPRGDCYKTAFGYLDKREDSVQLEKPDENTAFLVHGDVVPTSGPNEGCCINHAWVEIGDDVHDVSNSQNVRCSQEQYYRVYQARVRIRYSMNDARIELLKSRNYGPWDTDLAEPKETH